MQFLEKSLIFGNTFGFMGENWVQKWNKTINFEYVPLLFKHLILRDCSEIIFALWNMYLKISTNSSHICGRQGP